MNKTYVIHHSADFDGLFCREIARKFLPDAILIGWDYGQPTPLKGELDGTEKLYMLDISIDDLMTHPNLVWIDHHKSAIEKWGYTVPGIPSPLKDRGYLIDGVAACRLAWQWFSTLQRLKDSGYHNLNDTMLTMPLPSKDDFINRKVEEPLAVRLVGEYDIWDKRDPDAELFQHGLRSQELSDNLWNILLVTQQIIGRQEDVGTVTVEALLDRGEALQYARTQENAGIITDYGFTLSFEGLTFLACNHARFNSHLFTAGIKPEHDALFGFKWTGKDWSVSLYHAPGKEHHDLSLIAVKHGGGGHRGACGFRAGKLPFLP